MPCKPLRPRGLWPNGTRLATRVGEVRRSPALASVGPGHDAAAPAEVEAAGRCGSDRSIGGPPVSRHLFTTAENAPNQDDFIREFLRNQ